MAKISVEAFVQKSLSLLEKERTAEINETSILREQVPLKELQRRGVCLLKLSIATRHTGLYGRIVLQFEPHIDGKELPSHNFTPGDIAGLYLTQGGINPADQLCSGIVSRVTAKALSIAFDEAHEHLELDDNAQYKLVKLANDVTYKRVKKALLSLDQYSRLDNRQLVGVLFGETEPGPPYSKARDGKEQDFVFVNPNLDGSQQEAVQFALTQREVAIIHGPPGTGKTTTVTEIILQAVKQGLKLLVCAPSNIAVDNLTEKLSQYKTRMVRVGHPARVLPSIQSYSLDAVLRNSDGGKLVDDVRTDMDKSLRNLKRTSNRGERQRLREDMKQLRKELRMREVKAFKEVLRGMDVVLATLTMATQEGPLKHVDSNHFDLVIIDECSQAMEAACWIALQQSTRCILAGDHNQLPPTIISHEAAKEGLSLTLMERLLDLHGDQIMRMLTTQYRMHEAIMTWPSQQLYEGRLTAHTSVAHHLLRDLPGVADTEITGCPLLLVDTAGCDLEEIRLSGEVSKGNEGEADIVTAHIDTLVDAGLPPQDIAVIAPYNLQVELLRLRLAQKYPRLEIKSVDGFQGREKEAVVISLVRSNDKGEVGFLAEDRRINVAITRARRHLAVVCDTDTVGHHEFLKAMVDYLTENGEVKSAQEYIQAGALNTDIKRPEYLDEQIDRHRKEIGSSGKPLEPDRASGNKYEKNLKKMRPNKSQDSRQKGGSNTANVNSGSVHFINKTPQAVEEPSEDTSQFIQQKLAELMLDKGPPSFNFPPSLTGKDRKLVHEMCENLGLQHISQGEGTARHIVVSKTVPRDSAPTIDGATTKKAIPSVIKSEENTKPANPVNTQSLQQQKGKPAVFEKPRVSDPCCSSVETQQAKPSETHCSVCDKNIPKGNYDLHQLRCREEKPSSPANKDVKPKAGKKAKSKSANKNKKAPDEEEDFDTLIAMAISDNRSCHFPKCKSTTATIGQNCQFCARRFCLSHHIAESHGCGDNAKAHARATISREGVLYRGSGIPNKKPDAVRRGHLERKLGHKLDEMADKRKVKKKDK